MSNTVGTYLAKRASVTKVPPTSLGRRLGVEIEVEDAAKYDAFDIESVGWMVKSDPSLRTGGREFITPPILKAELPRYLDVFYAQMAKYKWKANTRTGIHVHVDCRDFGPMDVAAIPVAYTLCELAFYDQVGSDREENIYCVPWYRADSDVQLMAQAISAYYGKSSALRSLLSYVTIRACKYSGLYLAPLSSFGTIEFRHAPTWYTARKMSNWAACCYHFVQQVKAAESPQALMDEFLRSTPSVFARKMLGPTVSLSSAYNERFEERDCVILAETILNALSPPPASETWVSLVDNVPESHIRAMKKRGKKKHVPAWLEDLESQPYGLPSAPGTYGQQMGPLSQMAAMAEIIPVMTTETDEPDDEYENGGI